jgi:hypothetical protein
MQGAIGSHYLTADGAIGVSGKPVRIYSATWLSDGTARDLVIRHGTTASDTIWVTAGGTIDKTVTVNWEGGLLFPNGAFFDIGSAVSAVFAVAVEA